MSTPNRSGFEARTRDPERRAFFDIDKRIAALEAGGGSGGAGGDEVFIGPDDPGGAYELWYDTDAPSLAPRGFVALIQSTVSAQLPAGVATNMGGAQNVTFVAGRHYRITVNWTANRAGGQSSIGVLGSGNTIFGYWWTIGSGWDGHTMVGHYLGTGQTYSVSVTITPGAVCDHSGVFVLIEDMGGT